MNIFEKEKNDLINEEIWISSVLNNPVFDFLKDDEEDIYSIIEDKS